MPTPANRVALYSSKTDDWPTPLDFYQRLDDEFGFTLDVCSSVSNHKAPTFYALDHPDADRRDGLSRDWAADALAAAVEKTPTAWMNPSYGRGIGEWMRKAFETAQSGVAVVCLVPVRTSSAWWHDLVLETGAEVRYVKGRLKFGSATTAAPFGSAVVIYRPTDIPGAPGPTRTVVAKVAAGPSTSTGSAAA